MPATTDNIPDKPKFDVYAMLVVLTFLFTLGASLMLNDNLDKVWDFWVKPEQRGERAEHITKINEEAPDSGRVKISELDRQEWGLAAGKDASFPVSDYEWPQNYDVNKFPVKPNVDNLNTIPANVRDALMAGYRGAAANPAPPAPPADGGGAAAPAPVPAPPGPTPVAPADPTPAPPAN